MKESDEWENKDEKEGSVGERIGMAEKERVREKGGVKGQGGMKENRGGVGRDGYLECCHGVEREKRRGEIVERCAEGTKERDAL